MLLSSRTNCLFRLFGITVLLVVAGSCKGFFVNPTVTSVSVSPATNTLPAGSSRQLSAIATNNDGSTKDVTSLAIWDSSDTTQTFVTVSATGFVKALQNSSSAVTITATYKGFSGTATVTVGQAITVTCTSCSSGNSISLSSNGGTGSNITLSSSAPGNWSSSSASIISVTGSNTTSPTATLGGTTGTATITVSGTSGGSGSLQITVTQ